MKRALIFTAKNTETNAVKSQLIGPIEYKRAKRGNRYNIYKLRSAADLNEPAENIEVALYETGRGQDAAILAVEPICESFKPDIVLYVGCAGGEPEKLEIGDVFVATHVWNYEPASVGKGKNIKLKGSAISPDRLLIDEAKSIAEFGAWLNRLAEGRKNNINVHFDHIASGQKVIKHTESITWKNIKENLSDDIIACETEGHGFLTALVPLKTFGMMIRGISDNLIGKGEGGKAVDDDNQSRSTAHAAAFAAHLIEEIDGNALKGVALVRYDQEKDDDPLGIVVIRIETGKKNIVDVISKLFAISNSERFSIKNIEKGSLIITIEVTLKSVLFFSSLFRAGMLDKLIGYQIYSCISSITTTRDSAFDAWMAAIAKGDIFGEDIVESSRDKIWLNHINSLVPRLNLSQFSSTQSEPYDPISKLDKIIHEDISSKNRNKSVTQSRPKEKRKHDQNEYEAKKRFHTLRYLNNITVDRIARTANVSKSSVILVTKGGFVSHTVAEKMYDAMRELINEPNLRFDDIFLSARNHDSI